jgi:hypothetical protein
VIEKINLEAIQAEIGEVELKEMHDLISQLWAQSKERTRLVEEIVIAPPTIQTVEEEVPDDKRVDSVKSDVN